jgi:hypothetical protein
MEPAGVPAAASASASPPLPAHLAEPDPQPVVAVSTIDADLLPRREAPAPPAPPRQTLDGDFLPPTNSGPPHRSRGEMPTRAFVIGGVAILVLAACVFFFFVRDANSSSSHPARKPTTPRINPIKARLADRVAESQLRTALTVEKVVYTDFQAYASTIASLKQLDHSVHWSSQVHVVVAHKTTVCLSEKSASGTTFAVADVAVGPAAGTYYGPKPCPAPLTASSAAKLGHNFNR